MTPRMNTRRLSIRQGMTMAMLTWVVLSGLYLCGLTTWLDRKLTDLHLRIRGEVEASDQIALVTIDDKTFSKLGIWPLPRENYALLLKILEDAGAKVIGVDLQFLGKSSNPRSDLLLAEVTAGYKNIVHAISFPSDRESGVPGGQITDPAPEIVTRHGWLQSSPEIPAADAVRAPYRQLLEAAPFLGHVDVGVDPDGCIRRIPMLIRHGDRVYPFMGLLVSILEPGDSTLPALHWTGHGFSVTGRTGVKRMIPTDRDGYTSIGFAGDRGAFRRSYSMIDVLQWYQAGERDRLRDAFRGRIVLVGNTAMGEAGTDLGTTPFSPVTPLIYVHANSIDAILKSSYLHQPSNALVPAILGALSLLFGWLFVVLSVPAALLVMTLSVLIIGATQQTLFVVLKMSTPSSIALFLPPAAYLAIASYRYVFLERRTREREKELAVARDIQRRLLPSGPPRREGLDIFGANLPAQEVGGDYYDWIPMRDGSLVVVIGDVAGKGVSAALLMSNLQALCHAETHDGSTPGSIIEALNAALYRSTDAMRYATIFLAIIAQGADEIVYANGGHNPGLLVRDGRIDTLGTTGLPVGLFEDGGYQEARVSFLPEDLLVLYSDGITECARKDVLYGEERLKGLVLALAGSSRSAAEIGQSILDDVLLFSRDERYADDITLVVVRRAATPAGQGG